MELLAIAIAIPEAIANTYTNYCLGQAIAIVSNSNTTTHHCCYCCNCCHCHWLVPLLPLPQLSNTVAASFNTVSTSIVAFAFALVFAIVDALALMLCSLLLPFAS